MCGLRERITVFCNPRKMNNISDGIQNKIPDKIISQIFFKLLNTKLFK